MHKYLLFFGWFTLCFCISCNEGQSTKREEEVAMLFREGDSLLKVKDNKEALLVYKQLEVLLPDIKDSHAAAKVYNALGRLNQESYDFELAREYYDRALQVRSPEVADSAETLINLTGIYYYHNRSDSMEWCNKLLEHMYIRMDSAYQQKMICNVGALLNELTDNSEAMELHFIRTLRGALWQEAIEDRLKFHSLYDSKGNLMLNDSVWRVASEIKELPQRANLRYLLYKEAMRYKRYTEASLFMSNYLADVDSFSKLVKDVQLQKIQQKYNESKLQNQNTEIRNHWYLTILIALLSLIFLSFCYFLCLRLYRQKKEKELMSYQKDRVLLQQKIEELDIQVKQGNQELEGQEHLLKEIDALQQEKQKKEVRIRQLETIFKAKNISAPIADVEAVQVFRNIMERGFYSPSADRYKLQHWLDMAYRDFADRLNRTYPFLSDRERDVCFLTALDLDRETIAGILGVQVRSVDRYISRICERLGFAKGNKDDFTDFISRFKWKVEIPG